MTGGQRGVRGRVIRRLVELARPARSAWDRDRVRDDDLVAVRIADVGQRARWRWAGSLGHGLRADGSSEDGRRERLDDDLTADASAPLVAHACSLAHRARDLVAARALDAPTLHDGPGVVARAPLVRCPAQRAPGVWKATPSGDVGVALGRARDDHGDHGDRRKKIPSDAPAHSIPPSRDQAGL